MFLLTLASSGATCLPRDSGSNLGQGCSGCSGKLAPCMCKATHCTCASSPCIFKLVWSMFYDLSSNFPFKNFFGKFSKKSLSFWLNFGKHKKSYFVQKRLQTLAHNVLECRTKVNSCFCTVKWAKIQQFIICRGFCRDPLPCSGFILYLHFAGGKSSAGPLLYKP